MKKAYSLTEAKARFSEIVDRLIKEKQEVIVIRKNGENAAVLVPYEQYLEMRRKEPSGLILAAGALADYEEDIDEMMRIIMEERKKNTGRKVDL